MKNLLVFVLLVISGSLAAQNFPFLKVGNEWRYVYINSESGKEVIVEITIVAETEDGFEVVESRGKKDKEPSRSIWFVEGEFLKEFKKGSDKASSWNIMKSNPQIGDKWESNLGFERIIFEISKLDEIIYTPAGRFEAYEVLIKNASGSVLYTTYFNENVGPLRGSSAFNRGELLSTNF
jgi:hypothetical protein